MSYKKDVYEIAKDTFSDMENEIKDAIIDGDECPECYEQVENGCNNYPSLTEAAEIIDNCENEETDTGLWEGQQPEEALKSKAFWCQRNDAIADFCDLFNEVKDKYEEEAENEEGFGLFGEDGYQKRCADRAWDEVMR